jgi:hypothetical protein
MDWQNGGRFFLREQLHNPHGQFQRYNWQEHIGGRWIDPIPARDVDEARDWLGADEGAGPDYDSDEEPPHLVANFAFIARTQQRIKREEC